jgi:hypothetical protein
MAFTRTSSGLTNLAQFHGVEVIIYTEGGDNSYTFEDVFNGKFNRSSIDIKFWSAVFIKHNFNRPSEFRALGSKSVTNKICEMIENSSVKNIIVARDSDLDDFLGGKFLSPFILYTRGYSWENDVYQKELVKQQIHALLMRAELDDKYIQIVDDCYSDFQSKLGRLLKLELVYRKHGKKFITSMNGERFIDGKTQPKLKICQVRQLLRELRDGIEKPVYLHDVDMSHCPFRYCYGKLQEALAQSIISYVVGKLEGRKSVNKENIIMAMIERYKNNEVLDSDQYYEQIIGDLKVA